MFSHQWWSRLMKKIAVQKKTFSALVFLLVRCAFRQVWKMNCRLPKCRPNDKLIECLKSWASGWGEWMNGEKWNVHTRNRTDEEITPRWFTVSMTNRYFVALAPMRVKQRWSSNEASNDKGIMIYARRWVVSTWPAQCMSHQSNAIPSNSLSVTCHSRLQPDRSPFRHRQNAKTSEM